MHLHHALEVSVHYKIYSWARFIIGILSYTEIILYTSLHQIMTVTALYILKNYRLRSWHLHRTDIFLGWYVKLG